MKNNSEGKKKKNNANKQLTGKAGEVLNFFNSMFIQISLISAVLYAIHK